jgi:hypothetical protein
VTCHPRERERERERSLLRERERERSLWREREREKFIERERERERSLLRERERGWLYHAFCHHCVAELRFDLTAPLSCTTRECCLLVLHSVTSTPQWMSQPKPRGCVHDVCVFVCECVLGRSRVSQPPNLRLCLLQHLGFLTSPRAIKTCSRCPFSSSRLLR